MIPTIYKDLSEEELGVQPDSFQSEIQQFDTRTLEKMGLEETTIAHFCEFVDFYTRHARNPMCTALTCEQQAETIRISDQDLCPETIHLLIETMLTAIDHLEKKWLDEQIHWEEVEQRQRQYFVPLHRKTSERNRKQKQHGLLHFFSQGVRWMWQRVLRHKPVPRQEVAAW
jgi:hypothetical protein